MWKALNLNNSISTIEQLILRIRNFENSNLENIYPQNVCPLVTIITNHFHPHKSIHCKPVTEPQVVKNQHSGNI